VLSGNIFGSICILLSVWGIVYLLFSIFGILSAPVNLKEAPYFTEAYLLMGSANLLFAVALFVVGVLYFCKRYKFWYLFPLLMLAQYMYFQFNFYLWSIENKDISMSVAAATGVTGGGTNVQDEIYFWLWGSAICFLLWLVPLTSSRNRTA